MTQEELTKAGYRHHELRGGPLDKHADALYQRKVQMEGEYVYQCVNVYWYDKNIHFPAEESAIVETRFYLSDDQWVDVQFYRDPRPIEAIETEVARLFTSLNAIPDPHND